MSEARARLDGRGRATPPAFLVLGADTADIVAGTGGFICDCIRAGFQIDVRVETVDSGEALRILGVQSQTVTTGFDVGDEWPDIIVFAAFLRQRHRDVRRLLAEATRRRHADLLVWGGPWPEELDAGVPMEHQLSRAAKTYKSYASRAAGSAVQPSGVEQFYGAQRNVSDYPSPLRRK